MFHDLNEMVSSSILRSILLAGRRREEVRLVAGIAGHDPGLILSGIRDRPFPGRPPGRLDRRQVGDCHGPDMHRIDYDDHTDCGGGGRRIRPDRGAPDDGPDAGRNFPGHQYHIVGMGAAKRTRPNGIVGVLRLSGECVPRDLNAFTDTI